MQESTQSQIDRFYHLFEENKGKMNCLKDKHKRVKITLNKARSDRAKCQEVYNELSHKDHRLEPALALFDLYIRDLINESDVCANRLREMDSDQCYYADKLALLEG
jgi:chromosome segregation ATPase